VSRDEQSTRTQLIDPALHAQGWTEDLVKREETAGAVEIIDGKPRRRTRGRVDYTLRVKPVLDGQPVAVALIEAKAEGLPPDHGLDQAKRYAASKRLNVPFVFATNGHRFVEFDNFTGLTSAPRPMAEFPSPETLQARYEQGKGFRLADPAARPLLTPYAGGEASRRYYQDAAIRATLEKVAKGETRALLSLATGAGKTFIAVNLLRRIADAGNLRRALFVCDRDELRTQATGAFQSVFGSDAAPASAADPAKNARVVIATYQTLDVGSDEATANFLAANYPEDYFSHIVIDECHRSAWGKWSEVLRRNPSAVQVGLTATPRQIVVTERTPEAVADEKITADNLKHFGEPVYEYDLGQGIEDGYLAACELVRRDINLEGKPGNERVTGIDRADLVGKMLRDAITGRELTPDEAKEHYEATSFEDALVIVGRLAAMAQDLFTHLLATGGPEQKTIIFCARDRHADGVAIAMNNLYAAWCAREGRSRADFYSFKCTHAGGGKDYLPDFRGAARHHFIATTVDLLTTGVDVPAVRNVVFFKYVSSPIAFYQMLGRGTRIDAPSGKLLFRVYDYTNATRLLGADFVSRLAPPREPRDEGESGDDRGGAPPVEVEGIEVRITDAGRLVLAQVDGETVTLTVEQYKERLAARLLAEAPTLDGFRSRWIDKAAREALLGRLPDEGRSALLVRTLEKMGDCDLYDVLAELGYGLAPRTRSERADAFAYKHDDWLRGLPADAAATVKALASQFARAGIDGLENREVFQTPEVVAAGGLAALKVVGKPADVLHETKERMFQA